MSNTINSADGESAVEHSRQESDPVKPAGLILPVGPDKRVARMLGWHGCYHNDCDKATGNDQEETEVVQHGQQPISEDNKRGTGPCNNEERNVDVPCFYDKVRVEDGIHLYHNVRGDGYDGGQVEDPSEKVQPACVEANDSAIAGTGCD